MPHEVSATTTNARVAPWVRITLAIILAVIAVPACVWSQQKNPEPRGEFHAPSISLRGLLNFFENYKGGTVSEAMVIKLIEIYGLDFRPTQEDLIRLRKASASDDLVRAVETARKPPPPKPVARDGHLTVVCEPVDCDVRLNGDLVGTTSHGLLPWITRPQGPVTVTAARDRYQPDQASQVAQIRPDEIVRINFVFKPSREALATAGATLLQGMFDSLGADGTEMRTFRATGTFYLQDGGGHRTAWSLAEWLQLPGMDRFEIRRLSERYQIARTEAGFSWKKPPKTKEAQTLEEAIRLVMDSQLANLVNRFRDPRLTVLAADLTFGIDHPAAFQVEGGSKAYVVTLDSANRPSEIKIESPDRDAPLRMLYSDYVQHGRFSYPKTTQIIRPDGISGVEARLDMMQMDISQSRGWKPRSRR